jgi:hypothetical protein
LTTATPIARLQIHRDTTRFLGDGKHGQLPDRDEGLAAQQHAHQRALLGVDVVAYEDLVPHAQRNGFGGRHRAEQGRVTVHGGDDTRTFVGLSGGHGRQTRAEQDRRHREDVLSVPSLLSLPRAGTIVTADQPAAAVTASEVPRGHFGLSEWNHEPEGVSGSTRIR